MIEGEARVSNGIITRVLTHTSYNSEAENTGLPKGK